jgi:excisionase family DNA binding protein
MLTFSSYFWLSRPVRALVYAWIRSSWTQLATKQMNSAEPEDSFLTVAEVAEMLKLNQQTVRNWIDQGSLPALRVGRRVRIKRSDFDRVLARSYTGGGPGPADAGPSAEDFWGGEPVGVPDPGLVSEEAVPAAEGR